MERWRSVPGFENFYEVSSYGRIRRASAKRGTWIGRILTPVLDTYGYPTVRLYSETGVQRGRKVHSLVAKAFLGCAPSGFQVNHKDGNKKNNYIGNLEYVTVGENIRHSIRSGFRDTRGENNPQAKLTATKVRKIRELRGKLSGKALARCCNIAATTVSGIR